MRSFVTTALFAPRTAGDSRWSGGRSRVDHWSRWLTLLGVVCIAALVPFWIRMMVSPAPQEMREGALLWSTRALLAHQNPYAIDSLPGPANMYGPLYPLVAMPVAWLLGPTLFAHRLVNGLGIAIACALIYRTLRGFDVRWPTALAGAAINLAGLLYWVGPTARPDGIGVALLVAAYAVMAPAPATPWRFVAGLLFSLAGLATKLYYVLPVVAAVVWIAHRHRPVVAARAAAGAALGIGGGVALLSWLFPAWAPVVLGANLAATTHDTRHLVRQAWDWAVFSLPLLVALAAAWRPWQRAADLWTVGLATGVAAVALVLGGHRGAHMTYFFHLITPPLTIVALRDADRRHATRLAFAATLLAAVVVNAQWFNWDMDRIRRAEATFARLSAAVAGATRPTGTSEVAPILLAAGVDPMETGHTEYFHVRRPPTLLSALWGDDARLQAAERRFDRRFYSAVTSGAFDLVIANRRRLDRITPDGLSSRYRTVDSLVIDLPWARQSWPVDIWIPARTDD